MGVRKKEKCRLQRKDKIVKIFLDRAEDSLYIEICIS